MLEARNLRFRYSKEWVIDDFNLTASEGIIGLTGSNGSGKSTILRLLSTALVPNRGEVLIDGAPTSTAEQRARARRHIGYMPQSFAFSGRFTVRESLQYFAWLRETPRKESHSQVAGAIELFALGPLANKKIRALSGGQRQRVGLAQSVMHDPRLLILDEPTSGLDAPGRERFLSMLTGRRDRLTLISSHYRDELEGLSDRLIEVGNAAVDAQGVTG
jgi:ABC-2 type transport system ATP-binding protein